MQHLREGFRIVVVGLLMGAAEVVPGVSGGTIVFAFGDLQE
ncbi:MAG: undecaprenyl phosphate translocase family protein [Pseudomonadales bacterium]